MTTLTKGTSVTQWTRRAILTAVCGVLACALPGCAGGPSKAIGNPAEGLNCIDDSARCVAKRQATLRYYMASPDRNWIRQRPDGAAYASGVRLFAYKRQKDKLSCSELKSGVNEANGAPRALKAAGGRLTPAQVSRGKMLAQEVGRDLKREMRRRCRG
ncbi:MAG: hypothetical protein AAFV45_13640 [Pseudomonadota bacterium]